jgi:HEPN domain-containing protein/predicted nucleotidyltransferase
MVIAAHTPDPRLDTLVDAIVDRVSPELVLLFGSRARGDAHEDSDYDLMIVVSDGRDAEDCRRAANDVRSALMMSVDVLARTVSQYQRWQRDPGFLDWLVAREGRLLYSSGSIPQRSAFGPDRVREEPYEGVELWKARAEEDFRAALELLAAANPGPGTFHAHACVEKLLKAAIVKGKVFPPRIHNLPELLRQLPLLRGEVRLEEACKLLWDLYPKSRYVPNPTPALEEAQIAVEAARLAREILLAALAQP